MEAFQPAYLKLPPGELAARASRALAHLERCDLCARGCHVNRLLTTRGTICRTGRQAVLYSCGPHHGEERPLSGWRGSGTLFFSWCNLKCVFCQNWTLSHRGEGVEVATAELTYLNLMDQYRPCYRAAEFPPLDRRPRREEFRRARECARALGLHRLDR